MESQSSIILLLLNNIEVILDKLLDLAGEKQRLVISGDCVGLDAIVKEEEEVLESLSAIQTQFEGNGSRLTGLAESEDFANLRPGLVHKTFLLRRLNDQNQSYYPRALNLLDTNSDCFCQGKIISRPQKQHLLHLTKRLSIGGYAVAINILHS